MPIEGNELERLQRETNDALGQLVMELRDASQPPGPQPRASGSQADLQPLLDVNEALGRSTGAMAQLAEGLVANASALRGAAEAFTNGGQGLLGALSSGLTDGGGFSSVLRSGFGLAPLAGALVGLFQRDTDRAAEPVFETIGPPPSIRLDGAATGDGGFRPVARGANDEARVVEARTGTAHVVVNVSAMDSQSFLTRSHDIARAVRDAMLHMDPLNDVIGEL